MLQDVFCDGTGGSPKDIREDIIQLKVGYGKIVMGTVLFIGDYIGEFGSVSY